MARPVGRPPKPVEEKIRTGNPGRRPLPDRATLTVLPGAAEPPEPMRPLGSAGTALWERVWTAGASWLAEKVDAEQVLIMCEQMDERVALRARVFRDAASPTVWRDRLALRALESQIADGLSVLAFNPTERSRLGVAEVKRADSADEDFFARRSKRTGR